MRLLTAFSDALYVWMVNSPVARACFPRRWGARQMQRPGVAGVRLGRRRRGGETYIMGRVAVLPSMRRRGLASKIVEASDACARDAGAKLIKLHAQEYVLPLYAKAGYAQIAPVDYEDEGQPMLGWPRA